MTDGLSRMWHRLRDLVLPRRRDRDMQHEMQFHLDALRGEYREQGLTDQAAREAAHRRFGSSSAIKDRGHDVRGMRQVEALLREMRHAGRRLRRSPAFALAAVLTLGLAVGANAAIFTVVHRVVLNPLPYPESDRLIDVNHGATVFNVPNGIGMKVGLYPYYTERAHTLDGLAIYTSGEVTLTGGGEPERVRRTRATVTLAPVLRVAPALGRWFTEDEGRPGAPPVVVISYGLWQRRFGGDPGIVGRPVTIDGVPIDVVGVMPQSYTFPDPRVDLWVPEPVAPDAPLGIWTHRGVARMRDGVTVADVRADLDALIQDVPQAFPTDPLAAATGPEMGTTSTAVTLKESTIGGVATSLWILLAAVGLVLLVACANVTNLFLVRAEARQRELAVRRALGAGRAGIARVFLSESVWLALGGAAIGLAFAWGAVRLLVAFGPATLPRLAEVQLDGVAVAFTCGLSLLAALAFGSLPLWRTSSLAAALHEAGRSNAASLGRHRVRHLLMAGQVALALVLVASSGLMVRSFWNLRAIDPGFDVESGVTFSIALPGREYGSRDQAVAAHQAIVERLAALPGVTMASASTCLPLDGGCFGNGVVVEGRENPVPGASTPGTTSYRAVGGGYFQTMGIQFLRGRGIERADVERRELIAVVDQTFDDLVFPNEDAIGHRVSWSLPPAGPRQAPNWTWLTIVGVVANTPTQALGESLRVPKIYMPMSVTGEFGAPPTDYIGPQVAAMNYAVRTPVSLGALLPSMRQAVDAVDPNLAVALVSTLEDRIDRSSAQMAFTMVLLAVAAVVALALGLIGIYGVVAYVVNQRASEIGVRLALGAEPRGVAGMITRQGGLVTLAGLVVGLAAALLGGRLIESLLYEVSPRDPAVLTTTAVTLLAVALLACWLPARRAARVSPVTALRAD